MLKMSFSPFSTTPSRMMWSVPRDSSIEPRPEDSGHDCDHAGTAMVSVVASCISPAPYPLEFPLMGTA